MIDPLDDLRIEIWDALFCAEDEKSIDEIAQILARDHDSVRSAIQHPWFDVVENTVSISYNAQ